jgi:hypothetical protein
VSTRAACGKAWCCKARVAAAFLGILLAALQGCVNRPPPSSLLWGKGAIRASDATFLKDGETTREEVLLRFGGPDMAFDDGNVLLYAWGEAVAIVPLKVLNYTVPAVNTLVMEFDGEGRLRRHGSKSETHWLNPYLNMLGGHSPPPEWLPPAIKAIRRPVARVDLMPKLWTRLGRPSGITNPIPVAVEGFRDARDAPYAGTLFGQRWGEHGRELDIHSSRPVGELLRACVAKQLEREGFAVADSGTAGTLTGVIHFFKAEGNTVQLDLTLMARSPAQARQLTRRYQMTSSLWRAAPVHLEKAVLEVLRGFQQQLAADTELMTSLGVDGSGAPRRR